MYHNIKKTFNISCDFLKFCTIYITSIYKDFKQKSDLYIYQKWVDQSVKNHTFDKVWKDVYPNSLMNTIKYGNNKHGYENTYPYSLGTSYSRKENGKYKIGNVICINDSLKGKINLEEKCCERIPSKSTNKSKETPIVKP